MFYTGLFVPDKVTKIGSHIRDSIDLKRSMFLVVVALIPCLLFGMWNTGYQHFLSIGQDATLTEAFIYGLLKVLPLIIVAYAAGGAIEVIFAQKRGHEVNEGFLVTGMLIPLIVPADVPLWMVAIATAFATLIGKEVFGGTGMNFMNPALLTRAFLFFAYPGNMSGDKVWISGIPDGFSGATPLSLGAASVAEFKSSGIPLADATQNLLDKMGDYSNMLIGTIPGSVGETSVIAILIGAAILLFTGIGNWKTMISVFVGGYLMGFIFNKFAVNPYMAIPAWQHLLMGGFAFGAVFMATDPVSSAQTENGKYIYGFLIGVIAILVRVLNPAYPEGMMLAILLMNVFAPTIDYVVVQNNIKKRLKRAKVKA
jgi:Na+-transporting NADH:ubiquinone oxidoreductase subunit B